MSGCVNPVNLSTFVKDKEVEEIIEKGAGVVYLTLDSTPGLKAGNQKITGLDPVKYYMVEELDEKGDPVNVQFVSADGQRSANLTNIGLVSGGEITGLTNRYNYRVKAAGPLPGNVSFNARVPPAVIGDKTADEDGVIKLPASEDNRVIIYSFTPPSDVAYDIAEISISPVRPTWLAQPLSDGTIMLTIGQNTTIDFVFFGKIEDTTGVIYYFYFLTVTADDGGGEPPEPGEDVDLVINVTALSITDQTFGLTPSSASFSQATLEGLGSKVVTITLNDPVPNNIFIPASIKWTVNGKPMGNGNPLNIDFGDPANIDLLVIGTYTITIEATTADGVPYSGNLNLGITP